MKVNIEVDINLLFHRWVHYLANKPGNDNFLSTRKQELELIKGVHSSLCTDINKYRYYLDRVILTIDSKYDSWRKFLPIKEKQSFYKEKRNKDYNFDYGKFLDLMTLYCKVMQERGIYVIDVENAEGDDLCHIVSNILYERGESSIITTSDSDIRQLIKSSQEKFIFVYDSFMGKKTHYIDKYIDFDVSEEDKLIVTSENIDDEFGGMFDEPAAKNEELSSAKVLNDIYDQSEIVNPSLIAFCKMLAGDKGDNVPSVYYKPTKKGDKFTSFTELRAEGVYAKMIEKQPIDRNFFISLFHDETLRRDIASKVLAEVNSTELVKIGDIADNIKRNLQFTLLDDIVYTPDMKKRLYDSVNQTLNDKDLLIRHKEVISGGYSFDLLKGTELETSNDTTLYHDDKRY